MFLLRLVAVLAALAIGGGIAFWLFTGDRRYLRFAGRIAQIGVFFALFVLGLMAAERLLTTL